MAASEAELVRRAMRLGALAAIRSEEYAAAVQRLRGCDGGTCRLIGKLEILVDRMVTNIGDFGR